MARFLHSHGVPCWSDVMLTPQFSASRASVRTPSNWDRGHSNSLQSHINENMKVSEMCERAKLKKVYFRMLDLGL